MHSLLIMPNIDPAALVASWDGKDKDYHRNRKTSQGTFYPRVF